MKHIDFYLDFVSPYAWLALEQLPQALQGLSYHVSYKPVLLGALVKHYGHGGPAAIAPKRDWTYRQVAWLGHSLGVGLQMPAQHPFSPVPLLGLALATSPDGCISRHVARELMRHVWHGGQDALDPERLHALQQRLTLRHEPGADTVRAQLRQNTQEALAAGAFGVPTWVVEGRVFWGLDALPLLRACLEGDPWLESHWDTVPQVVNGLGQGRQS